MRAGFNASSENLGLTFAQARVLVYLSRNQGVSQARLAAMLEVQPITLLRQVDRLADLGLIQRRPNPTDRRAQQLFLTNAAEPFLQRIRSVGEGIRRRALDGLDDNAQTSLLDALRSIRHNLSANGNGTSDEVVDPQPDEHARNV